MGRHPCTGGAKRSTMLSRPCEHGLNIGALHPGVRLAIVAKARGEVALQRLVAAPLVDVGAQDVAEQHAVACTSGESNT